MTNAEQTTFADSDWKQINLPHDWSIVGPYAETNSVDPRGVFLPTGIGWYRKHFLTPESLLGKKVSIDFDGVYRYSDVWLNDHFLGHYPEVSQYSNLLEIAVCFIAEYGYCWHWRSQGINEIVLR